LQVDTDGIYKHSPRICCILEGLPGEHDSEVGCSSSRIDPLLHSLNMASRPPPHLALSPPTAGSNDERPDANRGAGHILVL
jgi:hypothetical protein